jgi:hypothetical protein
MWFVCKIYWTQKMNDTAFQMLKSISLEKLSNIISQEFKKMLNKADLLIQCQFFPWKMFCLKIRKQSLTFCRLNNLFASCLQSTPGWDKCFHLAGRFWKLNPKQLNFRPSITVSNEMPVRIFFPPSPWKYHPDLH